MDDKKLARLGQLLDRELSAEEKERLHRIQDILDISDHDGLWDVVIAMEYQRKYYDDLPEKISAAAAEIFNGISQAAEKEVALAQSRLAESVVRQAEKLSQKTHMHTWLMWGVLMLILLLLFGSLLLWGGYSMGSGQAQPPAWLLKMPVGVVVGVLCFGSGILGGILAAKDFSEGNVAWRKRLLAALGCALPGGWVFSLTVF